MSDTAKKKDAAKDFATIKLQIPAGQANPSPPVGPALGQHGVNIMGFCKEFNEKTQQTPAGSPVSVVINVKLRDRSFTFVVKTPPASYLIMKAVDVKKGSGEPNKEKVGKITREQLAEIAKTKEPDLTAANIEAGIRTIAGTARSMGVNVPEEYR